MVLDDLDCKQNQAWTLRTISRQGQPGESTWARKAQKVTLVLKSRSLLLAFFGLGESSMSGMKEPKAS
jgi:hypothetical protein